MRICAIKALFLTLVMVTLVLPLSAHGQDAMEVNSAPLQLEEAPRNGMVRVRLSSLGAPTVLDITIRGSYTAEGNASVVLQNGDTARVRLDTGTGQITLTTGGISVQMGSSAVFRRHQTAGQNGLQIAQARQPKNLYPGDLSLTAQKSGSAYQLRPIVHVYLEEYLYGVLPYEMGPSWPLEALKAQAVAARTYTLSRMGDREASSYDVVDTTNDQVYNGSTGQTSRATQAVDATRGIVLLNNGQLTQTFYTASNGGQTESAKNAWNSKGVDYLSVKEDPFDALNTASSTRRITVYADFDHPSQNAAFKALLSSAVEKALSATGTSANQVQVRRITSMTPHTPKYPAPSRLYTKLDVAVQMAMDGQLSPLTVTFDIFADLEGPLGMSINAGKNELWTVTTGEGTFLLTTSRYGHGIGMSQRGAQQMANLGYTYDQILAFYYDDCVRMEYAFTHTILPPVGDDITPVVRTEPPATLAPARTDQARVQLAGVGNYVTLRTGPSANAAALLPLPNGASVTVLARGENWTVVSAGELTGYLPTGRLIFTGNPPVQSTAVPSVVSQWAVVAASSTLNLRAQPEMSAAILTRMPNGAVLAVLGLENGWARVQYGTQIGYCDASYLQLSGVYPTTDTTVGDTAQVQAASGTVLRRNAAMSSEILLTLENGTWVSVLTNDGSWCEVEVSGQRGFVLTSMLDFSATPSTPEPSAPAEDQTPETPEMTEMPTLAPSTTPELTPVPTAQPEDQTQPAPEMTEIPAPTFTPDADQLSPDLPEASAAPDVTLDPKPSTAYTAWVVRTVSALNLRSAPDAAAQVLVQLAPASAVTVHETRADWTRVSANGQTGYVATRYLTDEEPMSVQGVRFVATNGSTLALRETPAPTGTLLTRIPYGSEVTLLLDLGDWCYVQYEKTLGYCAAQYLRAEMEESQ